MTKQMLMLSPFFYPEPVSTGRYNSFLVKALVQKGISVDVICFHPLYPDWRPRRSHKGLSGAGIYRGGAWINYPKDNVLRRVVLECSFLLYIFRYAGCIKRYSQIIAVLPPMLFLPLVWMAASPDARVTAIVHDVQGVMAGFGVGRGRRVVVGLVRLLERVVLRCCHRVVALSWAMASHLAERYGISSSKIAVCLPFVSLETRMSRNRLGRLFAKDKMHVVYAGALGEKQNPEGLVSFFRSLVCRRDHVVCHIFSRGPLFKRLKGRRKMHDQRLQFHDLVPEEDLYELYLRSNIQVIPQKMGSGEGAVPSKLPNLLAAGVPILYIGDKNSDVWDLLQKADVGLCADSWEIETLIGIVDRLLLNCENRSHEDRQIDFHANMAEFFSVDALIRELIH